MAIAPKSKGQLAKEKRAAKKAKGLIHRKRKNPSVRVGQQRGELEVLKTVPTKAGSSGGQKWRVRCSCGTLLTVPQWYLVRKEHPKTHCGCKGKTAMPNRRERGIWYMMHRRCYNSTHVAFKHYGGADPRIGVCDSWNKDVVGNEKAWENFIKDMGPAPTPKHTLDRIDPYAWYGWIEDKTQPSGVRLNCRWATAAEQMSNLKRHWAHPDERKARIELEAFDTGDDEDDADTDTTDDNDEVEDSDDTEA